MSETLSWPELMRRGRISLAWDAAPKRKRAQARLIKTQMQDPAFRDKWAAGVRAANQKRLGEILSCRPRFHSNHPHPLLPPMTKKERSRYKYLRTMTDRQTALKVIAAEREAEARARAALGLVGDGNG